jgi:hypothetical protein
VAAPITAVDNGHGVDMLLSMICDSEFATMTQSFRHGALRKRGSFSTCCGFQRRCSLSALSFRHLGRILPRQLLVMPPLSLPNAPGRSAVLLMKCTVSATVAAVLCGIFSGGIICVRIQ